jgi:hypothetical protein
MAQAYPEVNETSRFHEVDGGQCRCVAMDDGRRETPWATYALGLVATRYNLANDTRDKMSTASLRACEECALRLPWYSQRISYVWRVRMGDGD